MVKKATAARKPEPTAPTVTLTVRFKPSSAATVTALKAVVDDMNERNPDAPQWNLESLVRAILSHVVNTNAYPPAIKAAKGETP